MKTLYLAEFKYGKGRLIRFESDRETDKNYMVINSSKQMLIGDFLFISSCVSKDKPVFAKKADAVNYLIEKTQTYIRNLQKNISMAKTQIEALKQESE